MLDSPPKVMGRQMIMMISPRPKVKGQAPPTPKEAEEESEFQKVKREHQEAEHERKLVKDRLKKLEKMRDDGILTEEEYEAKRAEAIERI